MKVMPVLFYSYKYELLSIQHCVPNVALHYTHTATPRTQDGLRFRSHRPSLFELTWHHRNMFAETAAAAFAILLGVDCGGGRGDPPSLDLFAAYLECKALFVGNPMAFLKQCSLRHLVSGWNLYAAVRSVPSWIGK